MCHRVGGPPKRTGCQADRVETAVRSCCGIQFAAFHPRTQIESVAVEVIALGSEQADIFSRHGRYEGLFAGGGQVGLQHLYAHRPVPPAVSPAIHEGRTRFPALAFEQRPDFAIRFKLDMLIVRNAR